jgi:hypothetical protein
MASQITIPAETQNGARADHSYIDTVDYNSDDLELPDDSDYDSDELIEEYEDRVEDEDWENAERGDLNFKSFNSIGLLTTFQTLQSSITA